jgi:Transglycosylase SLT domain
MSGALAQVPMGVQVINPWKGMADYNAGLASQLAPAQAAATVQETQARSGLLGQQAIGAGIQNQVSQLGLGYQQWMYGQMASAMQNSSYGGSADDVLANNGQMPQQQAAAGPGGGGAIGTYATTSQPAASPDGSGAPATPAIGASGPTGAGSSGGPSAGSRMPAVFTGQGGVMLPGFAQPMTKQQMFGYMQAQDKAKAMDQIIAERTTMLRQRIMQTLNGQGQVDPDQWNVQVKQAFNDGLITNVDLQRLYNHPALFNTMQNAYLPPEQSPQLQGQIAGSRAAAEVGPAIAKAGGEAAAQYPYKVGEAQAAPTNLAPGETRFVPPVAAVPGVAGGAVPVAGAGAAGAVPVAGAPGAAGGGQVATPYMMRQVLQSTEASGPNAVSDKGAAGKFQIMPATFKQYALPGEQFSNENDREIVAGRAIDDLARRYPGDPARQAVGYFSGTGNVSPAGSATPWNEDRSDGHTLTSQYVARAQQKLAQLQGGNAAAGAGGGNANAGVNLTPVAGGGYTATPALTPGDVEAQKNVANQVKTYQDERLKEATNAGIANAKIDQARLDSQTWTGGYGTDHIQAAAKLVDGIAQRINAMAGKDIMGSPDASVGDWESFNKNVGDLVRTAVRETSPRAAVQEFMLISKTLPSSEMSDQGKRMMFDELQGLNDWYIARSNAASKMSTREAPNAFDANWSNNVGPEAFIMNRMSKQDMLMFVNKAQQTGAGQKLLAGVRQEWDQMRQQGLMPTTIPIPTGRQIGQ